jgi:hypothetical protein
VHGSQEWIYHESRSRAFRPSPSTTARPPATAGP